MAEIDIILTDLPRVRANVIDGSITDAKVGERTIDETLAIVDTGNLTALLSAIAHCIKAATGSANWKTAPTVTIAGLQSGKQAASGELSSIASIGSSPGIGAIMYHGTNIAGWLGLGPNTSTTRKFLRQTGTGTVGNAPAWDTLSSNDVGLGNATNTSDANKPVSTAQAAAIALKFDKVGGTVSGATDFTARPTYGGHGLATQSELTVGAYLGGWNASTNTPTLTNTPDAAGSFYLVTTAGSTNLNGNSSWTVGDQVRSNGTIWQRVPSISEVASVNGKTGAVVLVFTDIADELGVAKGGTGATNAEDARTNLGLSASDEPTFERITVTSSDGFEINDGANVLIYGMSGDGFPTWYIGSRTVIWESDYLTENRLYALPDATGALALTGNITGVSDITHGGTNATTAGGARTNLGLGDTATLNIGTTGGTVAAGNDSRITGAAQKASNLSDLASASTARTNLGLGTSATKDVGTAAGTVAAGDHVHYAATIDLNTQGTHVLTVGRNHIESTSAAGASYTFSGAGVDGGPATNVNFVVTSGPITIVVPSSRGLGDTSASTSVTIENGYHELSFAYRAGNWWRVDY